MRRASITVSSERNETTCARLFPTKLKFNLPKSERLGWARSAASVLPEIVQDPIRAETVRHKVSEHHVARRVGRDACSRIDCKLRPLNL